MAISGIELESILVRLVGDGSSFQRMMAEAQTASRQATSAIQQVAGSIDSIGINAVRVFSTLGITASFAGMATHAIQLAASTERAAVSFGVMMRNMEHGQNMVDALQDFAAVTPLTYQQLEGPARMLLQYGVAGNNVVPTLRMIGDVASGDAQKLSSLAYAYTHVMSMGRLMAREQFMMIHGGFNPLMEMAQHASRTSGGDVNTNLARLTQQMHQGQITAQMVKESFQRATAAGGQFFQGMERQSTTLGGLWSTLKDNVQISFARFGNVLAEGLGLREIMRGLIEFTNRVRETLTNLSPQAKQILSWVFSLTSAVGLLGGAWLLFRPIILSTLSQVYGFVSTLAGAGSSVIRFAGGIAYAVASAAGSGAAYAALTLYRAGVIGVTTALATYRTVSTSVLAVQGALNTALRAGASGIASAFGGVLGAPGAMLRGVAGIFTGGHGIAGILVNLRRTGRYLGLGTDIGRDLLQGFRSAMLNFRASLPSGVVSGSLGALVTQARHLASGGLVSGIKSFFGVLVSGSPVLLTLKGSFDLFKNLVAGGDTVIDALRITATTTISSLAAMKTTMLGGTTTIVQYTARWVVFSAILGTARVALAAYYFVQGLMNGAITVATIRTWLYTTAINVYNYITTLSNLKTLATIALTWLYNNANLVAIATLFKKAALLGATTVGLIAYNTWIGITTVASLAWSVATSIATGGLSILTGVLAALAVVLGVVFVAALGAVISPLLATGAALVAVTGAVLGLAAAGGLGTVIVYIAALVSAFRDGGDLGRRMKEQLHGVWEVIQQIGRSLGQGFGILAIGEGWRALQERAGTMFTAVAGFIRDNLPVWHEWAFRVGVIVRQCFDIVAGVWRWFLRQVGAGLGWIGVNTAVTWDGVRNAISTTLAYIQTGLQNLPLVWDIFVAAAKLAWAKINTGSVIREWVAQGKISFHDLWYTLQEGFYTVWANVRDSFDYIWPYVKSGFFTMMQFLTETMGQSEIVLMTPGLEERFRRQARSFRTSAQLAISDPNIEDIANQQRRRHEQDAQAAIEREGMYNIRRWELVERLRAAQAGGDRGRVDRAQAELDRLTAEFQRLAAQNLVPGMTGPGADAARRAAGSLGDGIGDMMGQGIANRVQHHMHKLVSASFYSAEALGRVRDHIDSIFLTPPGAAGAGGVAAGVGGVGGIPAAIPPIPVVPVAPGGVGGAPRPAGVAPAAPGVPAGGCCEATVRVLGQIYELLDVRMPRPHSVGGQVAQAIQAAAANIIFA